MEEIKVENQVDEMLEEPSSEICSLLRLMHFEIRQSNYRP